MARSQEVRLQRTAPGASVAGAVQLYDDSNPRGHGDAVPARRLIAPRASRCRHRIDRIGGRVHAFTGEDAGDVAVFGDLEQEHDSPFLLRRTAESGDRDRRTDSPWRRLRRTGGLLAGDGNGRGRDGSTWLGRRSSGSRLEQRRTWILRVLHLNRTRCGRDECLDGVSLGGAQEKGNTQSNRSHHDSGAGDTHGRMGEPGQLLRRRHAL